jgi:hypothetical protein
MRFLCGFALLGACLFARPASASDRATASVMVYVDVCSRTSLRVSSDLLRFKVLDDGGSATATVDFNAAARVPPGANLVLTVEPLPMGSPFESGGSVALGNGRALTPAQPAVAARWQGSGVHAGRIVFTLRDAEPGAHELPVRFVLSTP